MKFSYKIFKKFVPNLKNIDHLKDILVKHLFEVESSNGDVIDIKILPNRYSDAASYAGLARELGAILDASIDLPKPKIKKFKKASGLLDLIVEVPEHGLCTRYMARYFEININAKTPDWMRDALAASGVNSINIVVDIMNYAMLETGQPMHVYDADKLKSITVRRAKVGEKISTLDGGVYELTGDDLVIADGDESLAIAGVKGGKRAEVTSATSRIVVESANFDGYSIYRTSKRHKLTTDASVRFAHHLSPALTEIGMMRATELLAELCDARVGELVDSYPKKKKPVILKFSINDFIALTGITMKESEALNILKKLGFKISGNKVTAPSDRMDIERFEDLADEIVRIYGYDKLPATPPVAALKPANHDNAVLLKSLLRQILPATGFSEQYNYSFVSASDIETFKLTNLSAPEISNPISAELEYLRPSLSVKLFKNTEDNARFYDASRFFEIGRVFRTDKNGKIDERLMLGLVVSLKNGNPILEIKGVVKLLLEKLGLMDYSFDDIGEDLGFLSVNESLRIESDHCVLGYLGATRATLSENVALAEMDLIKLANLMLNEREYEPIPKFPAVTRDISLLLSRDARVNDILTIINDVSPRLVYDVDLIDYYEDDDKVGVNQKSLTFRIVFQATEKTLTDDEVGLEMGKIISALQDKFQAEVR